MHLSRAALAEAWRPITIALLMLAGLLYTCDDRSQKNEAARTEAARVGRYQVVKSAPDQSAVLLDTITGRTWITCEDRVRLSGWGWCEMVQVWGYEGGPPF